jgi:Cu(I)/Ag(I) efflux system membrane fusion protein
MKKPFSKYIIALITAVSFLQACNNTNNNGTNKSIKDSSSEALYTCSMHPQVLEHHPGNCPICGMRLIKKNATAVALNNIDLETLLKPTNEFAVSSVPVATPQQENISIPVKAYGVIESDTRAAGTISANVSGRIEKLYLRYRFQKIEAGQKVAQIYSPELLTSQENLLFILKNDADNISFINTAKQKLLLLGMSGTELNKVIKTRKPLYSVSVYSNYSGHVHDAGMSNGMDEDVMENNSNVTQPLSLKEGMYVTKGQTLFMIMNHHKAWAALQIFPNEQGSVKKGDTVKIVPETDTPAVINGTIDFIEPLFRKNSKTLTARVYFHNMDMLTIGSQVTANIYTSAKHGLWLPQSSVLTLGVNEVTFLKSGKDFTVHKITAGIRVNDKVQILSGLNSTDTVAANAQYLMDSESFMRINNEK